MLIDEFLPEYGFHERHETLVPAPREVVRQAMDKWSPQDSLLWRLLLRLRGLGRPHGSLREWAEANGFLRLAETEDEVVYGQIGRFWAADERAALISPRTAEEFRRFADPRYAVAVMNVRIEPLGADKARVYTETRIRTLGPQARRRFRLYWLLIRPFSSLLRRAMLSGIKARAIAYGASVGQQRERSD
jgi:hypothetical protein